jgi:hypothetical protein
VPNDCTDAPLGELLMNSLVFIAVSPTDEKENDFPGWSAATSQTPTVTGFKT